MFNGNFKRLFLVAGICIILLFAVGIVIDGLSSVSSFASSLPLSKEKWGACTAESCETPSNTGSILTAEDKSHLGKKCSFSDSLEDGHNTELIRRNCKTGDGDYSEGTCAARYTLSTTDPTCGGIGALCSDTIPSRPGLTCNAWRRCGEDEDGGVEAGGYCNQNFRCRAGLTCNVYNRCE